MRVRRVQAFRSAFEVHSQIEGFGESLPSDMVSIEVFCYKINYKFMCLVPRSGVTPLGLVMKVDHSTEAGTFHRIILRLWPPRLGSTRKKMVLLRQQN